MAKNITILKFERDILFEELCSYYIYIYIYIYQIVREMT